MVLTNKDMIRFTRGVPAVESFPTEKIIECSVQALRDHGDTLLQYHPVRGFLPLRKLLAEQEQVPVETVFIGNGSIQILDCVARTLFKPGDGLLVERPTYDRTITTFRRAGMVVKGVALESDGPDLAEFEAVVRDLSPKAFYTIPDFQNPSGVTTSAAKRRVILDLADRYGFAIISDVPYRLLRYTGEDVPGYRELDSAHVIELSSFSKLLSPGIRVGWMVADEGVVDRVAQFAVDTYISPSMLSHGMVYEFLRRGWMPGNIAQLKALYGPRLVAILAALDAGLPAVSCSRPEGGFFLAVTLPDSVSNERVRTIAPEEGLLLSDGEGFFADGDGSHFLRLPFCALPEDEINEAVSRLARIVKRAAS